MSTGPTREHDPARAGSGADRGTQLGGATHVLTGVLTFAFRIRVALGRLLVGVLTIFLFPLTLLRRAADALLPAIAAILAPLVSAARLLLALVCGFLTVILLPLVLLGRVVAEIAGVLRLVAARVGEALVSVIGRLRRCARAVLAPFIPACRMAGRIYRMVSERLYRFRTWLGDLVGRSRRSRIVALIALGIFGLAALVITVIASPSSHSASYPVFAVLDGLFGAVLVCVLMIGLLALWVWLVVPPLAAFARLARRATASFVALLEQVQERMNRVQHSVLVAGAKAEFQATRSLQQSMAAPAGGRASTPSADPHLLFQAAVHQNEYLPRGAVEVNAIITVTCGGWDGSVLDGAQGSADRGQPVAPEAAEVILLDCSGSMAYPLTKLRDAQKATAAAIDSLRDGTWFALVRATERAELAYPLTGGLAQASSETRNAAKRAVRLLWPEGGTAMGQWLTLARDLLASRPSAIAHAILLTDGSNESESRSVLESALAECAGKFQCDCRGVGTDWRVKELRLIASRLLGTVDIVADPAGLETDFRSMIAQAMGKMTANVSLRMWTPRGASVAFLKQVTPAIEDLTDRRSPIDAFTDDYPTGAWGDESRDYHLCVRVPAKEIGDEMLASRVSMVAAGRVASQVLIKAIWTDDEHLSTRIDRQVAHYTGQAELADVIQEGLDARRRGDERAATFKLGRAAQLAVNTGNTGTMKLLDGVVEVEDPHTGAVRLKRRVRDADEMALDTRSTKTVRVSALRA